jgi:hypothetical protein
MNTQWKGSSRHKHWPRFEPTTNLATVEAAMWQESLMSKRGLSFNMALRGIYMTNENPVAQCRATMIGLFPIVSRDTKLAIRVNIPSGIKLAPKRPTVCPFVLPLGWDDLGWTQVFKFTPKGELVSKKWPLALGPKFQWTRSDTAGELIRLGGGEN